MAAHSLHEVNFEWPHPEPTSVIVTGTFDEWSCSVHLTKTPTGFVGSTKIPWGETIKFKYVVDGKWLLHENQATETDPGGFVNHVYTAPLAPSPEEPSINTPPESKADSAVQDGASNDIVNGNGNGMNGMGETNELALKAEPEAEISATSEQVQDTSLGGLPQFLSNLANTLAATEGTTSAIDYVASGLGIAIQNVVGVDPINSQQIAIPTPATASSFTLPSGQESSATSAAQSSEANSDESINRPVESPPSSPIASIVPLVIVPVNAAENNTLPSSPQPSDASTPPLIPGATPIIVNHSDKAVPKDSDSAPDVTVSEEVTPVATPSDPVVVASVENSTPVVNANTVYVFDEPASVDVTQEPAVELSLDNDEPVVDEREGNEELRVDEGITHSVPALKDAAVISVVEEAQQLPVDSPITGEAQPSVEALDAESPALTEHKGMETPTLEALVDAPVNIHSVVPEEAALIELSKKINTDPSANPPVDNTVDGVTTIPIISSTEKHLPAPIVSEVHVTETVEEPSAEIQPAESTPTKLSEVLVLAEPPTDVTIEHPAPLNEGVVEKEVKTGLNNTSTTPTDEPVSHSIAEPSKGRLQIASEEELSLARAEEVVTPTKIVEIVSVSVTPAVELMQNAAISMPPDADNSSPKDIVAKTSDFTPEANKSTPANGTTPELHQESAGPISVHLVVPVDQQTVAPETEDKPTAALVNTSAPDALTEQQAEPSSVEAPANGLVSSRKGGEPSNSGDSAKDLASVPAEAFPSASTATDSSPPPSKTNTMRKKRTSIFGKLKHIFHSDKDKEKK